IPASARMSGVCYLLRSSPRKRGPRFEMRRELDSRLRGNERSSLLTPFVPAKADPDSRWGENWIPAYAGMSGVCCLLRSSPRKRGPRFEMERELGSRLRGNERSSLLTPFVPAKAGTQIRDEARTGFPLTRE